MNCPNDEAPAAPTTEAPEERSKHLDHATPRRHSVRCVQCGITFETSSSKARTCGDKCRQAAHRAAKKSASRSDKVPAQDRIADHADETPEVEQELEIHPLANLIPEMSFLEFEGLRKDIKANGLQQPIVLFQKKVLDGRHRDQICVEEGIPRKTVEFRGTEAQARAFVLSLNVHRRHLTTDQKRAVIEAELQRDPSQSDRAIATKAKVSDKTVAAARRRNPEIPHNTERTESTGRKARGRKPAAEPKPKPASKRAAPRPEPTLEQESRPEPTTPKTAPAPKPRDADAKRILAEITQINRGDLTDPRSFGMSLALAAKHFS
jgi:ParB-like chromosome segregation protein Spo0J